MKRTPVSFRLSAEEDQALDELACEAGVVRHEAAKRIVQRAVYDRAWELLERRRAAEDAERAERLAAV